MTFESRPPALPDDLPAIAELSTRSEAVDQLDFPSSAPALEGLFARPGLDPQRDLRLWLDALGQPIAFAVLDRSQDERQIEGLLWMRFLPELRLPGLADQMIAWGDERLRRLGAEHGKPTQLASGTSLGDSWRLATLEARGFRPIRYFLRMERPLEAIEAPVLPEGFTLRPVAGDHEAEAWAELFNQAFIDHWNHHPLSAERVRSIWAEPLYDRGLDLVAAAPDGTLAAFCACEFNREDAEGVGTIEVLGTRRGFRSMGLGRAVLMSGLAELRRAGARRARLIVDAESLTGATRLYESAGFAATRRSARMALPVEEPG